MLRARTLLEKFNNRIFSAVHGNNIVYNTCWEDPALDREALKFNAEDKVLMITSAGCLVLWKRLA
jgi:S-adenosylmethionine-diacylglycerol 3-amino-3-carboxypropyl transferase